MHNFLIKWQKIIVLMIISAFFIFPTFAQKDSFYSDGTWHFAMEPLVGLYKGNLGEYVYYEKGSSDKLSYLKWELEPLLYAGVKVETGWKGLFLTNSIKGFIPSGCGSMQDSDWAQDYNYGGGNRTTKTNYSEHDNKLNNGFSFESEISCKFYPLERFSIRPSFGVEYEYFSFTGKDGTAWYGNDINNSKADDSYYSYDDLNHRRILTFSGAVIEYERLDFYTWLGCEFGFNINPKWNVSFAGFVSPYLYISALDSHLLNYKYFLDYGDDSFAAGKVKFSTNYKLSTKLSIKAELTALKTKEIHTNNTYSSSSKNGTYYKYEGENGFSSEYFEMNLSAKFLF